MPTVMAERVPLGNVTMLCVTYMMYDHKFDYQKILVLIVFIKVAMKEQSYMK